MFKNKISIHGNAHHSTHIPARAQIIHNRSECLNCLNKEMSLQTSRVPGEIKRREVELDPRVSPEEIGVSREPIVRY